MTIFRAIAFASLLFLALAGTAAMTQEEATALWESGRVDQAASATLDSARQVFLKVSDSASDPGARETAAYRAAMCLYYLKKGDCEDGTFHKEAGDFILAYPGSQYADDLAFHQAMIFVDRRHWGFVGEQMSHFVAAYPDSPFVPQAACQSAIALLELGDEQAFADAVKAFQEKWPVDPARADLAYYEATIPMRKNLWHQAELQFKTVAETWPSSPWAAEAAYQAAMCQYFQGYRDGFVQAFAAFESAYPGHARLDVLAFYNAKLACDAQDWAVAVTALKAYVAKYPASAHLREALLQAALCSQRAGDVEGCAVGLTDFKSRYGSDAPEVAEIESARAFTLFEGKQLSAAHQAYLAIATSRPAGSDSPVFEEALFYAGLCSLRMADQAGFHEAVDPLAADCAPGRVEELVTNRCDKLVLEKRWGEMQELTDTFAAQYGGLREAYRFDLLAGLSRVDSVLSAPPSAERDSVLAAANESLDRFLAKADSLLATPPDWLTSDTAKRAHLQTLVCEGLWAKKDFSGLATRAIGFAKLYEGSDPVRRADFLKWEGIALCGLEPFDLTLAAQIFDEVIAIGIEDPAPMRETFGQALHWRIHLAKRAGDTAKQASLVQLMRERVPDSPYKQTVLSLYAR